MSRLTISRRSLLLGLAASVPAMAITRRLLSNEPGTGAPAKRLVLVMQNNGTQQKNFWPSGGFTSPILEPLLTESKVAAKTNVVRGVFIPREANGTNANEHDMGFARMFTGQQLMNVGGQPWGGAASVDQTIARAWNVESLALGVMASSVSPMPKPGFDHRRSFSYVGPASHKLVTLDPFEAYARLFAPDTGPGDGEAQRRLLLRKSALDAVTGNLRELRDRLGKDEQSKLDMHLSSVRELEVRLGRGTSPGATCASKPPLPRDYGGTAPSLLVDDESAIPDLVTTMLDLIATSFGCGITRVATLQLGFGGGNWKFAWEGIDQDLHALAHKDTLDGGTSPENTDFLVRANRWYAKQIAYLAARLDAIPEDGGTMLDNTLIVWANEFARGDHSMTNVPIVLVGKAAGAIAAGGRLIDVGPQTFQRVGCTVLRAMGQDVQGFGDAPACGPLQGV